MFSCWRKPMKTRLRALYLFALLAVWLGLTGASLAQPTVTNLSFSPPTTINTFPANVTINFTVTGSGVYYVATALQDPNGEFIGFQAVAEAAGSCATDPSCTTTITPGSTVTASVTIPITQFVTPGTWQVAYIFVLDANGFYYKTTSDGSLTPTSPFPNLGTLTVNSTLDTTPPNITALSFTNAINTTSSAVSLGVNYTVTDAGTSGGPISGASSVFVGFVSPSGATNRG